MKTKRDEFKCHYLLCGLVLSIIFGIMSWIWIGQTTGLLNGLAGLLHLGCTFAFYNLYIPFAKELYRHMKDTENE